MFNFFKKPNCYIDNNPKLSKNPLSIKIKKIRNTNNLKVILCNNTNFKDYMIYKLSLNIGEYNFELRPYEDNENSTFTLPKIIQPNTHINFIIDEKLIMNELFNVHNKTWIYGIVSTTHGLIVIPTNKTIKHIIPKYKNNKPPSYHKIQY